MTSTQLGALGMNDEQILAEARFHFDADAVGWTPVLEFARALLAAAPAQSTEKSATLDEELQEIYDGWQDSEDGIPGLLRAIYDYGRSEQRRVTDAAPAQSAAPVAWTSQSSLGYLHGGGERVDMYSDCDPETPIPLYAARGGLPVHQ